MNKYSIKSDPILWKKIFSDIKEKKCSGTAAGQWSARKAQAAVKAYKKAGGEYIGVNISENSLSRWTKQNWKTKSGKKSSDTGERYLPSQAIDALSDKEYQITSEKKMKDAKAGKQFSKQPRKIAKKVKKFRN